MLNIITAPNSVLSQKAKAVGKIDKAVQKLLKDMEETLLAAKDPEGVGLAAPQIGKSLQIFLAKPTPKSPTLIFINPKIESQNQVRGGSTGRVPDSAHLDERRGALAGGKVETGPRADKRQNIDREGTKLEGCLSLPNIWGEVKRLPQIILSYMDINGNPHKRIFKGFIATIIQHETDHLNGILFPKRVLEQKGKLYKSRRNKKGEDIFEEIEL